MKKRECCFKLVYMGENFARQRSLCLGLIPLGKEVIRMICTNSYVAEAFGKQLQIKDWFTTRRSQLRMYLNLNFPVSLTPRKEFICNF